MLDTGDGEFLLDQLMKFPSGKYDDGVDACSAFGRFIDRIWEQVPIEKKADTVVPTNALIIEEIWRPMDTENQW